MFTGDEETRNRDHNTFYQPKTIIMKTCSVFQKGLLMAATIALGLLTKGCSKFESTDIQPDATAQAVKSTRASSEWHWRCPNKIDETTGEVCGFLNGGWRNNCAACNEEYSEEHGQLLLTLSDVIELAPPRGGGGAPVNPNLIQLPGNYYPIIPPQEWYEKSWTKKYYDDIKKTMKYFTNHAYAEAVDFAWYRTVRMLYPGKTNKTLLEWNYEKWLVNDGRYLKGDKGYGLKDGTKAAIDAYVAY